jgi:4-hydroxy-3-polyprenylbenzoate decarboxylase
MTASLRTYLSALDNAGQLDVLTEKIPLDHGVAAALSLTEAGPALRFDSVEASALRVVGNVVNTRDRIALALGVAPTEVGEALLQSIREPLPVRRVETAACQQVIEDAHLGSLPIPRFFQQESGAYITAGVTIATDALTGERNMSFARYKVLDDRRAMLGVSPNHHLGKMVQRAAEAGVDLPVAVAIGTHPAIMLAACLYLGFGDDELECAGRLLGEPVDVVQATASDNLVPADAELILEGVVKPAELVEEGLVSEFHGHYHDYGRGYVVEFARVTRRDDAIFQVIVPGLHQEHLLLGAVSIAAGLHDHVRALAANVVEVAVPDVGAGRTTAVISVRDVKPGQARQLMMACFSAVSLIKQVVIVDADIDPWNVEAVEWARVFHARPDRDFLIVPGARTDRSDPLAQNLTLGKLGVDATRKPGERAEGWAFARVPESALADAAAVLARAGVTPQRSALLNGIAAPDAPAG